VKLSNALGGVVAFVNEARGPRVVGQAHVPLLALMPSANGVTDGIGATGAGPFERRAPL
jgi:hypothetical protein